MKKFFIGLAVYAVILTVVLGDDGNFKEEQPAATAQPTVGEVWWDTYHGHIPKLGPSVELAAAKTKMVWVKCVRRTRAIPYPHFNGTTRKCYNPGMYVRVPYWFARLIGTYPIILNRETRSYT